MYSSSDKFDLSWKAETATPSGQDTFISASGLEGVAVSAFQDKSNLSDDEYKNAIAGTGFEVIKVVSVDKIITDPGEAVKILD